ncbi:uncharacterized protein ARMOST_13464 [Armillaria ostoyae]|uniref:Uncharacterized protein n=1 Tax=Armillaria ostoyae TaxID=47428 RepID=A0A284RMS8_ARMOS|nr:uncharacterized protein ARMOST_13464 [Armillaria ostoyae]
MAERIQAGWEFATLGEVMTSTHKTETNVELDDELAMDKDQGSHRLRNYLSLRQQQRKLCKDQCSGDKDENLYREGVKSNGSVKLSYLSAPRY